MLQDSEQALWSQGLIQIVLGFGQSPSVSYAQTEAPRAEGARPRSPVHGPSRTEPRLPSPSGSLILSRRYLGELQCQNGSRGCPMPGRQSSQSGQAQRPPGNHLEGEKVLRTRAWGGSSWACWPTSKDLWSLFPPSTDVSPSKQNREDDGQFQEGWGVSSG